MNEGSLFSALFVELQWFSPRCASKGPRPRPSANSFWVFAESVGEDERATRAGADLVTSNI